MAFERINDLLNSVTAEGALNGVTATVVGRDGVLCAGATGNVKSNLMFRYA